MLPAAIVGLVATLAAMLVWTLVGPSVNALESTVYDRWLRSRAPVASPSLLIVTRDPAGEAQLGPGPWDRGVLARLVVNLARAGAPTIGLDVSLGSQAAATRGGAAGDALLAEATATAGNVVYPMALDAPTRSALAPSAKGIGHVVALTDPDGVVRRVPLFVDHDARAIPAFGLALAAAFKGVAAEQVVIDRRLPSPALVPFAGAGLPAGVTVVAFSTAWSAIESRQIEALEALVADRLVLVLTEPASTLRPTPVGAMTELTMQAHLANALLTGTVVRDAPRLWTLLATVVAATLAAWLWLRTRWWQALAGVAILVGIHAATVILGLTEAGVVVPVGLPLAALVLASAAALIANHFASARRFRQLEGENARVRDALVRHESTVEALEEDLEAARTAVARSTGAERDLVRAAEALRAQLAEARAQEEETRRHLGALEDQLRGLRPAERVASGEVHLAAECESLGIVTRDPGMLALFGDVKKGARSSLPILLLGEPGTGKEIFARAAHRLSPRAGQPFVPVNVGAIPADLFESEMFGHVRGSFTGAVADRKGHFAEANGGTVFLDELGDLRPEHQVKLLRVLQEKTFYRVGTSRPTTVDVRVVAASNRDLERGVTEGWFREDLYFRLKGLVLRLPPLRERTGDIPLLATRLFRDIAAELGREGLTLSQDAVGALAAHDWPGNVRELQNVLRQAATLTDGPTVTASDLRLTSSRARPATRPERPEATVDATGDTAVLAALREHRFDMQATGRALGWDRSTVTQRLKGLGFRALVEAGGDRTKAALALAGDPALARTVEVKLRDYHEHLLRSVEGFADAEAAVAASRRRFKNLPERHFRFLESLVRARFER